MNDNRTDSGALPVYVQIAEIVAREIASGRLVPGVRLPPEREMARTYSVAVATLRKSLSVLRDQGLISSKHGSGNYVLKTEQPSNVYAFFRLETLEGGGLPNARLLSLEKVQKPKNLKGFGQGSVAYRFRRLRTLDGIPAAVEEIWLDGRFARRIEKEQVSESLYLFYKSKLGYWIVRAEDRIGVDKMPNWGVDQFSSLKNSTCGFIERTAWNQEGEEMEYSQTWFDPNYARYVSRLR